ncbi:hypothetical protein FAUST_9881 [Fusarium austroamericanum]|uniref:Uncharacterized protein n=1 Tax=Fusarium austroamericanum TaxID=282268 RepID=A0AAN5Z1U4_FUSAU|nr:hypothetical protein FAUST_9881 [Fusarium austroamericanum]
MPPAPSQAQRNAAARVSLNTTRLQRVTALPANNIYCLHCFRAAKDALTKAMSLPPARKPVDFEPMECRYPSASSSRCAHCGSKNYSCEPVYPLLTGNSMDVLALTHFARLYTTLEDDDADDDASVPPCDSVPMILGVESRQKICGVVLDLWDAFDAILQAHAREYSLGGASTSKKDNASNIARYRDYVVSRRQLLVAQSGPRPSTYTAVGRKLLPEWESNQLLRLEAIDPMYPVWLVALEAFSAGMSEAFNLTQGEDVDEWDEWVVEQMGDIPVQTP